MSERTWEDRYEYAEELAEERQRKRASQCRCLGLEMPGYCPGPRNCPMVEDEDTE